MHQNRFIDQGFELRIIFAQHTARRLLPDCGVPTITQLSGFRFGALRQPAGIIHHKGDSDRIRGAEGIPVIFGAG